MGVNMRRLLWRLRRVRLEPWQRNLYTIVGAELVAILGFSISNPFLAFYIQELGVTDLNQVAFWVGLINSAAPIMMAVSSPIWGVLSDRFGRKPMLVRAMLGGSVLLGLCAFVTNVPQLAALRIIQGAVTGTVAAAVTLVATSVPREHAGYALGLLQSAVFAANSLGPSLGGFIGGTFGYHTAFLISGILLFCAGILVVVLVHEKFERPAPQAQRGNALLQPLGAILREPMLLSMISLLMLNNLAGSVTNPVLSLYVQTLVGSAREASTATGMILGVVAIANALAAVLIGRSADKLGPRRTLLACVAVASISSFPQMFTRTPFQLLLLRAVMGFAMGAISPIANAVIAAKSPEGGQGSIYGMSTSLNALGQALGPMLGTYIVTSWSLSGVFPATGAILAVVVLIVAITSRSMEEPRSTHRRAT